MSKIDEILSQAGDNITVKRVYGKAYEKDGVTLIPAAAVRGGAGGGGGERGDEEAGLGAGFGITARPVGAYQIKDGEVSWIPAADTTRVIVVGEVVAIVALLVVRSVLRARRKAKLSR